MRDEPDAVRESLGEAVARLVQKVRHDLVPDSGIQFAYARVRGRDVSDVATVTGGLVLRSGSFDPFSIEFGNGGVIATTVLTAMKFDRQVRSAAIIRCTPVLVRRMEARFMEVCSFDPTREPPGVTTMDWGVAQCCREGVPDAVYTTPPDNPDAVVRLFGLDPGEVANNIIMLSG